jgi:hypothetical protein
MGTITIGNRSFETPVLVPSISSFETQLQPIDALRLQHTLREPISLVSAYDVRRDRELVRLSKEFRKQGVLLLDSGGYESSRISRYAHEQVHDRWDYSMYIEIAGEDIYDFIFSFDYFLEEDESLANFEKRLLRELQGHAASIDISKLIPVIHLRPKEGKRELTDEEIIRLFQSIVSEIDCRFVAVPERELGSGITARARLTRKIVDAVRDSSGSSCELHILGCGNLLSFALLDLLSVGAPSFG